MLRTKAPQLAWLAGAFAAGLCLLNETLSVQAGTTENILEGIFFLLILLAFLSIGVLIAARQPHNPIGWILIIGIYVMSIGGLAGHWINAALTNHPGVFSPTEALLAALTNGTGNLSFGIMLFFTVLYFPTGRLPSRRWKWVPWVFGLILALSFLLDIFRPGPLDLFKTTDNPLVIESLTSVLISMRSALDLALPVLFFGRGSGDPHALP